MVLLLFLVAGFLLVSLTACGGQSEKMDGSMDMPKAIEEASKQYDELMKQENEIFSRIRIMGKSISCLI